MSRCVSGLKLEVDDQAMVSHGGGAIALCEARSEGIELRPLEGVQSLGECAAKCGARVQGPTCAGPTAARGRSGMHRQIRGIGAAALVAVCQFGWSLAGAQQFWSHRIGIAVDVPYGDDPAQVADIYTQGQRPPGEAGFVPSTVPRPTLIWIHGGGWIRGDKATNGATFLHYLERGWNVVNINYRQGPGTAPLAVDDAVCAYKWVVDNALESGSSNRFVVSGASAGGHLALMVGQVQLHGCMLLGYR